VEFRGLQLRFFSNKIESVSARAFNQPFLSFDRGWVEQTYARTVSQRKPSEALAETLGDVHPARNCAQDFWEITAGFELLPVSDSGGFDPKLFLNQLSYETVYGPPWQPDDYIAGIRRFPTQITSANTSEGLKVVTDNSGVGELGSIAPSLQNCW